MAPIIWPPAMFKVAADASPPAWMVKTRLVDAVVGMHICAIVPTAYGRVISASSHFQWKTAPK